MISPARCISRSCTTGWLDWVHGELWLLPDGLIRRRLSLAETRANGLTRTVPAPLPTADPAGFDPAAVLAGHRTNKVIAFAEIASARLKRGRTADALRLSMVDGTRHRLLWLVADPAHDVLSTVLPRQLGDRLRPR